MEEELSLKSKKVKTHYLRKVLKIYAKSKNLLIVLLICLFVGGGLGILSPIFSANALSNLAQENFDKAIYFSILMCGFGLARVIFNGIAEAVYSRINSKTKMELTKMVIGSINTVKMSKLDETKLGVLAERLSSDVNNISDTYLDMMNLIFDILTNVVFLIYIAYLNFYIFLILLAYVFVLYFVCTIRSRIWIRGRKVTKKANEEARSAYIEQISGIRDVKLLNIKDEVTNFSNDKYKKALSLDVKISDKRNIIRRVQSVLSIVFELTFLIVGIIFLNKEMIMLTGLLVIYTYYGRVEGLVNFLSSYKEYKSDGEIAAARVYEVIENYEKEQFGSVELTDFQGNITFKDVHFKYKQDEVLKGINLEFKRGQMTAIVGKSGSGKTTILNLLSKLYTVSDGEILLDDKNINELTEQAIRGNVGEISQSPYIFNTTIRQNLLFAKPDASEKELEDALKFAQIYDDVMNMQDGLETEIGENGIKISGGQKQRLAIARLILKDPKVIVFDEATSALDNISQKKIVEMLEKLKDKKTIIVVAHRLSTIIGADNIFMIDDGQIIASGTHQSLMKNCKKYYDLYVLEENAGNE